MRKFIFCLLFLAMVVEPIAIYAQPKSVRKKSGQITKVITDVEQIVVESPVGSVPRLPYQVLVTYSDQSQALRQVKWSNSALSVEKEQAQYPVGKQYTIVGHITGDNTTAEGYPIEASVTVVDKAWEVPAAKPMAEPLPIDDVTITGDNRLTSNRDLAIRTILSWDVSQQLYNYRDTYGLSTEGYTPSDGWDSPTTKLKGHGSGHYMSALAFAFASATTQQDKDALRRNIARMVNELRECQERTFVWNEELGRYWEARDFAPEEELRQMKGSWAAFDEHKKEYEKYGYGYLNAIPAHHPALIEMYRGYDNNNWVWAPYYSIHKQLAGLIDIATYVDDKALADKALLIAKDMGLWIWNRLHYRTFVNKEGSQAERRSKPGNRYEMWNMYIAGEDGGTGESLARLSEMVSDKEDKARLLEASNFFDSPAFYDPLSKNIDDIRTRHANQHIPKITSALRSFRGNANPYYYNIAYNFWNMIQGRYAYATGGVGNGEMFRQPYTQILSMNSNVSSDRNRNMSPNPTINETCCAYNLAKLSKDLNCFDPDNAQYMDYYERVLYNQIVGSLHATHYMTTYQYAVGLNAAKPWGNTTPQSSCCGGTGSENHVKYQEAAYFVSDDTVWVALYLPSSAKWQAKGVTINQESLWPSEHSRISVKGSAHFSMKLRVPYWATEGFDVKLNGQSLAKAYKPCSYVEIPAREWSEEDVVEVIIPFTKHINFGPDKMERAATALNETNTQFTPMWVGTFMYGPLAMAAEGVSNWTAATLNVDSALADVECNGATKAGGTDGNLYSMTIGDLNFKPDYYHSHNSTHYFRINLVTDSNAESKALLAEAIQQAKIFSKEHYTAQSFGALSQAISDGETLYQTNDATKSQISKQIKLIDKSVERLEAIKFDLSALESAIMSAEQRNARSYTWDSYAKLQGVLAESKEICAKSKQQSVVDRQRLKLNTAISDLVSMWNLQRTALSEAVEIASQRQKAQQAWNDMEVKVPEYSPWATYGYARMMEQYELAQTVMRNEGKNFNQQEIDAAASALNAAINSMRPGNLPELEDLEELQKLVSQVSKLKPNENIKQSLEYAEMVVKYVSDGSGTKDMISEAEERLRNVLKK